MGLGAVIVEGGLVVIRFKKVDAIGLVIRHQYSELLAARLILH